MLLFGVGLASFVVAVVVISVTPPLGVTVFIYSFSDVSFGFFIVDTFLEGLLVSAFGVFLLSVLLYMLNGLVSLFNSYVHVSFGRLKGLLFLGLWLLLM